MDIFGKKKGLPRREFKKALGKAPSSITDRRGKIYTYTQKEKLEIEKDIFGRKDYGYHISKRECKRALRELMKFRKHAITPNRKVSLDKKIKFLEGVSGFKNFRSK